MEGIYDQVLSISELNEYARMVLSADPVLENVRVSGEISGYKHHYSGHRYFTLKDERAKISCVMFRQDAMSLSFQPEDGAKVVAVGRVSIFPRDGSYQLYVRRMEKSGRGDLYEQLERTKEKLRLEGLFDDERKRRIPMLPKRIGVVTSRTGAVIHDIIRVARRRNPQASILLAPCAVQGDGAGATIAAAIEAMNARSDCDVLLVGRGGGSIEDLWAFNEEIVVRAIAASRIPVISCVGHEVDWTLSDLAADVRAATPSAAAEMAMPVLGDLIMAIDQCTDRLAHALERGQQARWRALEAAKASPCLKDPWNALLNPRWTQLNGLERSMDQAMNAMLTRRRHDLEVLGGKLESLDPMAVLDRGFAYVRKDGRILNDAKDAATGDTIDVVLRRGRLRAQVLEAGGEGRE